MKVLHDRDIDMSPLEGKTVGIVGFGSQGRAHAENLRDSGIDVMIGLRPGSPSAVRASEAGFPASSIVQVAASCDVVSILVPDNVHAEIIDEGFKSSLRSGSALLFAHAFSVHFQYVIPPAHVDVIMVAPHAPGQRMRELYTRGKGPSAYFGVYQDTTGQAEKTALAYAKAIGCGRGGVVGSSFADEAVGDLFGEQAVLCGGLPELLIAGFETLVVGGLPPENAYLECVYQLDLIVDLIKKYGIEGMYERISLLAEFGSYKNGPRIINRRSRHAMRSIFEEIRDGKLARDFVRDNNKGFPRLIKGRNRRKGHPIDLTGKLFRTNGDDTAEPTPSPGDDPPD